MKFNRRDWLRTVGSLGVAVAVAGCSSGSQSGDGSPESTETTETQTEAPATTETTTETTTASADFGESDDGGTTRTKGPNPAETEKLGSVATDKQTSGLAFADYYHYEMNGLQGVAGTVRNEGDTDFERVTVHVTVEPGGAGPYSRQLEEPLPTGETQRFQFKFGDDAPSKVESFTIWATGES